MTEKEIYEYMYESYDFIKKKMVLKEYSQFEPLYLQSISYLIEQVKNSTCENCKYCDFGDNIQWCDNEEVNKYRTITHRVDKDFGCNKFKRKDK